MQLPNGVVFSDAPLEDPWIRGGRRGSPRGPMLEVRSIDEATFVLRESMTLTWEAPFVYLLLGSTRAVLFDTGAVSDPAALPLRATVDELVGTWLEQHPCDDYELVVAHSHGHNDHTSGDAQFVDRSDTTIIAKDVDAIRDFFGVEPWPTGVASFDLGDRPLLVTGIPGHDERSIALLDPARGLLLSGDTAYPGRLYTQDLPALRESLARLVDLAETYGVERILGGHIEVDRSGREYPVGLNHQPDESPLPLSLDDLRALRDLARSTHRTKGVVRGRPMSLYLGRCTAPMLRQAALTLVHRVRGSG